MTSLWIFGLSVRTRGRRKRQRFVGAGVARIVERHSARSLPKNRLAGSDEHRIRERAYDMWIEEGRPHGRDLAHWQRAHRELQREAP